jgi:hypothetical protein
MKSNIYPLSIVFIQLRFGIFEISPQSTQLLKGEVIPATRSRRAALIGTFHTYSSNFSRLVMEIRITGGKESPPAHLLSPAALDFRLISSFRVIRGNHTKQTIIKNFP